MEYEIYRSEGLVEVVTHGEGDPKVFQDLLIDVLAHPDWKPGNSILMNHTDLKGGPLDADKLRMLADIVNASRDKLGSSRMAILTPGSLEFGLGRMWQTFVEDKWDGTSDLFRSKKDAERWLMKP
jgi:hypothetical protein